MTTDIYQIYNWLMEFAGYPALPDVPYERRLIEYEDAAPMLYLKYRLLGKGAHKRIKHLVIDEMQDYSYMQYLILAELFSCSMTILGDRFQTMDHASQDVMQFLPRIFGKKVRKIYLNKSYRNTLEISRYAAELQTAAGAPEQFLARHGKEVAESAFSSVDDLLDQVVRQLRLQKDDGYETAAVLAMTEDEAHDIYMLLKNRGVSVSYIDRDSTSFHPGLTVTTFYLAKGLEFDQVFTIYEENGNPLLPQARYICATRALHELYMYRLEPEKRDR